MVSHLPSSQPTARSSIVFLFSLTTGSSETQGAELIISDPYLSHLAGKISPGGRFPPHQTGRISRFVSPEEFHIEFMSLYDILLTAIDTEAEGVRGDVVSFSGLLCLLCL